MPRELTRALELTVLLSTLMSVVVGLAWLRRKDAPPSAGSSARPTLARLAFHPLAQLLFVCFLLYVNQVLFSAYVLRAHDGSAAFIARYIPGPWFAIGRHDPLVGIVATHVGDGRWLSPSLLRVQAFLELPFTMFAYLAVARLLGRRLHATLCRLPVLFVVAASFSITFSIIELALPNPYTSRRPRAARPRGAHRPRVYCMGREARAARPRRPRRRRGRADRGARPPRLPRGRRRGARLVRSAARGRLPRRRARREFAVAVAGHRRRGRRAAGVHAAVLPAVALASLRRLLARCGAGGLLVVGLSFAAGVVRGLRRTRPTMLGGAALLFAVPAALFAAGWATRAALMSTAAGSLPELVLARAALSFLAVAIVVLRGVEFAVCWAAHETKAPADEA